MRFLLNKMLTSAMVVFGSVTLVFVILYWLPGDAATMIAGPDADPQTVAQLRSQIGMDRPVLEQYADYVLHLLKGDLGTSFVSKEPVLERILSQFPATLALTALSALFAVAGGIVLGVTAAIFRNRWIDNAIRVMTLFGVSMPTFWIGILLILVFSIHLKWFPAIGNGSLKQLILPAVCLGLASAGTLARMVRNSVLEVVNEPFVLTLRAKGLTEKAVMFKHVLRNALIPAITLIGVLIGELLAGSVVTETVFSRQGLGRTVVDAIVQKDVPVVQGAILFAAVFYVLINLLVDLSYAVIDPRVRKGRRSLFH